MPVDNGLSIAEAYDQGIVHGDRDVAQSWQQLATWYRQTILQTT
jgi:hypothetical protein